MGTMISSSHRFIFLHVPKTAGRSVDHHLGRYRDNRWIDQKPVRSAMTIAGLYTGIDPHRLLRGIVIPEHAALKDLIAYGFENEVDNYFKFAIVRNPWDRAWSEYNYHLRGATSRYLRPHFWKIRRYSFVKWLEFMQVAIAKGRIQTQRATLIDPRTNDLNINRILRFESLGTDFANVCDNLGINDATLPRVNVAAKKTSKIYSEEEDELIRRIFAEDIETFEYQSPRGSNIQ